MQDNTLQNQLLSLLVQPMRIDEIRRALPEAGKNELKDALDSLIADGKIMKNKKNRFAVSALVPVFRGGARMEKLSSRGTQADITETNCENCVKSKKHMKQV